MTKPTRDEEKNGWTEETLTFYVKERDKSLSADRPAPKPDVQNHRYRPHRWRD